MYCAKYAKIYEKELQEQKVATEATIMLHILGLLDLVPICEQIDIQNVMQEATEKKTNNNNNTQNNNKILEPVLRQDQPK